MRRIQVVIDRELDEWLEREAGARKLSKSALIRECVSERATRPLDNGLSSLPIFDDVEPVEDIDEYLYGTLQTDA